MPHPANGFSWNSFYHVNQTPVIAAIVLIMAGWAIGFFAGRMSAWVFPVINSDRPELAAVVPKAPLAAARTASEMPAPTPIEAKPKTEFSPLPKALQAEQSSPTEPEVTVPQVRPENASPPANRRDEASARRDRVERNAVLLNPDRELSRPSQRQRDSDLVRESYDPVEEADVKACERRYASFRRSDGTYQPYGRSSRELCPLSADD